MQSLTTAPFGRDRRDTIAVGHVISGADPRIEIFKPDSREDFPTLGAQFLTWGDIDRDGLPDAITRNGNPLLDTSIAGDNSFDGAGDSKQSNRLQGDITVTVARRLPNGNLVVRGQKWIGINQGREFVRIQGVIRPIDIQPDNSIASTKVADARISYGGQGPVANANSMGWLHRFFNSPLYPF